MKRVYNQTAASVRISNFVCFPAFVIVFVLATPIASLIYNAPGAGPAVMISQSASSCSDCTRSRRASCRGLAIRPSRWST